MARKAPTHRGDAQGHAHFAIIAIAREPRNQLLIVQICELRSFWTQARISCNSVEFPQAGALQERVGARTAGAAEFPVAGGLAMDTRIHSGAKSRACAKLGNPLSAV
jgi:hypothetical protein